MRNALRTFRLISKARLQPTVSLRQHNNANRSSDSAILSSLLVVPSKIRAMATSTSASAKKPTHPPVLHEPVRLACIQLASGADKAANLAHARDKVLEASREGGAKIVVLPECFNSPYGCDYFPSYAEQLLPGPPTESQSPSYHALAAMAREAGVYLVAGSIPEVGSPPSAAAAAAPTDEMGKDKDKDKDKDETYYNTALIFSPSGALLQTHRKVHLFDISIPGKITFRESDVLSPGDKLTMVDLPPYGRIGVAICYDIRFPELATIAARRGCFALVYPGAFNLTTGPLHWSLLARARAVDNQVYVALCSPARDLSASYHAWGHSLVVDPMAEVLVEAAEGEAVVYADLTPEGLEGPRERIPLRDQRRFDVYPDVSTGRIRLGDAAQDEILGRIK